MLAAPARGQDFSYNILPPGQYGNLPTTVHSTDQLPLYDSLTPLRGNVSVGDIERLYKPEDFEPCEMRHARAPETTKMLESRHS